MKVTKKLNYQLSIGFLIASMMFSSLIPKISLAEEMTSVNPTITQTEEQIAEVPVVVEEEVVIPEENPVEPGDFMPEQNTEATTSDDPEPYIQRDEIKSLSESLNIAEDTANGAFVYNYPLEVPAGRNSLQPNLSLTYNNQNNDNYNLFGYGWSINIPYIERLNKTGVEQLYTDNYFTSSLTGELVAIDTNGSYASKVENGEFFDYQYDSVSNLWTVTDKQGTIYIFGQTAVSRQDNPSDVSQVYKWLLAEVRDTNDNFIRYEYYKDAGQIYPYKIFYTGHGATDGIFIMEFLRENRNDVLESFSTGFSVTNNYRIYEIDIKIDNQWVTKYHLSYSLGDNSSRSLLDNITKGAYDENTEQETLLPEDSFSYINDTKGWTEDTNYTIPFYIISGANDTSLQFGEINGDGLQDAIISAVYDGGGQSRHVYINNGDGTGWTEDTNYTIPFTFLAGVLDTGTRLADINSDGLIDVIQSRALNGGGYDKHIYINNGDGTGWTEDFGYNIPFIFLSGATDTATRLADVNGDGLTDVIQAIQKNGGIYDKHIYINNGDGTGWIEDTNYTIPFHFMSDINDVGVRLVDINNDNLVDAIWSNSSGIGNPFTVQRVYINNGDGSGWTEHEDYVMPFYFSHFYTTDVGSRLADINNDGFIDVIQSYRDSGGTYDKHIYINNGDGTGWTEDMGYTIPATFLYTNIDLGARLEDVNGDGLTDIIQAKQNNGGTYDKHIYINNENNEFLEYINTSESAQINIAYQSSAQATTTSGLLNPELPFVVQTVKQITIDDGLGNESTIDYAYSDGKYYYNNPQDKKFAGFGQIEKIIDNTKTITYYHQGNTSNTTQGEYNDSYHKIGRPYRKEVYDNNTDELLNQTIYKWEEHDQGDGNKFVYNTLKSTTDFTNATKSTATQYQYSTATGNLLVENNLGEVTVNTSTGAVTNILSGDEKDTDYDYAENSTKHILSAPKTKTISNSVDSKQQNLYYDEMPLGQVDKVNLTKEDYIEDDVEINRSFNSYGLVNEQSDPKFATTTIAYDTYNMYPESSTDPLNNVTYTEYNLLNGQVATSTAPNGAMTVNSYDAFGRLIESKISDSDNYNNLVLKQEINYQDINLPRYQQTKDYFDISIYVTSRQYYDGLDRVIQTKTQTATANEYSTIDIRYDSQGRVYRQSLPYITTTIEYTTPNLSQAAKTYTYDALDRVLTETTPVGTTSYAYDGFKTTITDANNNIKELTKDAHGNLVEVKEHNDSNTYTTSYDYSLTNKLEKITDSQGNIRNFHYDVLDNLDWQDMVHLSSATSTPQISYTHDKNGNVLTETSFKGDNISYIYDDLNRVLFEKLAGVNQISYTYDLNGDIGQLSSVVYADGNSRAYDYDILGNLKTSTTTIEGENFVMHFGYNLNGQIKSIIYPNNFVVTYDFNNIGQVETVSLNKGQGNTVLVENIDYNQNGQMTHLERSNGVDTDYTYDPEANFRLTDLDSTKGISILQDIHYDYDGVGNITQIIDNSITALAKTVLYDYDDLNRLASSTVSYLDHPADNYSLSYDYDSIGNMTYNSELGTLFYNNTNPHQLSTYTSTTLSYDNAGNTLDNDRTNFYWDWRNRLKKSTNIALDNHTYYEYDHNNQRLLKYTDDYVFIPNPVIEPPIADQINTTAMFRMATEQDPNGYWTWRRIKEDKYVDNYFEQNKANQNKTHILLNGIKIATVNHTDNPYFILGDHLGSSSILTTSTGTIAEMTDYLPYGKINYEQIITNLAGDYGFTGKERDEETGIQYYGARYLDNEIGRFTSIDPVLLILHDNNEVTKVTGGKLEKVLMNPQQLNSYVYSINNPVVMVDNNGEWPMFAYVLASKANPITFIGSTAASLAFGGYFYGKSVQAFLQDDYQTQQDYTDATMLSLTGAVISGKAILSEIEAQQGARQAAIVNASPTAQKIASGHAYDKHVIRGGEFSDIVKSRNDFTKHIDNVMKNPTAVRNLQNGRRAYWQENTNTIVIKNPNDIDGGTAFQPDVNVHGKPSNYDYFNSL